LKDAMLFKDLNQNRPTADFAELLARDTAHLPSFGLVGHSQGGLASTHVHNYIWTALEGATGPRKVSLLRLCCVENKCLKWFILLDSICWNAI
jgi:hypothetical protein